jgi:tRNA threonylcarbamoyladenosine biosynthesis protein TsaE
MDSPDKVASPTFAISKVYQSVKLKLHHFDFYRLAEADLMEHELEGVLEDPDSTVVVEWGDIVKHVLPDERLTIIITKTGEDSRRMEFICPKSLQYLVEDL